ncbi:MAG: SAF domain-containing protein [Myxococcota bacterium]
MSAPRVGIVGTGFIARGVALLLERRDDLEVSGYLTRRSLDGDFALPRASERVTHSVEKLARESDVVLECAGDPVHSTEVVAELLERDVPVVTMDSELHVTSGHFLARRGRLSEGLGDQPGSIAYLAREAREMGFEPLVYGNVKGFLNQHPTPEDMAYWGERSGISLPQVTAFTDGTKVQIEQVLVANGMGASIARRGLIGPKAAQLPEGAALLADAATELGAPISDYVLCSAGPPGVFVVATHDAEQAPYLRYYKLGEGPHYLLTRPFHLCHLEVVRTLQATLRGDPPLLDNGGARPRYSVAAVAKRDLAAGTTISRGLGSFDVRGEAVATADEPRHLPIGLMHEVTLTRDVAAGATLTFDDVEGPDSLAKREWLNGVAADA